MFGYVLSDPPGRLQEPQVHGGSQSSPRPCSLLCIILISDTNLLSDVAYVLCLDSIGKGDNLNLHVSKPPKEDTPGGIFLQVSKILSASTRGNLSSGVCEQQRPRPASAYPQSDQRLCYSLIRKNLI